MTVPDECELVGALQRGSQDAFDLVVRHFGSALLATARRMLGDEHEARDCLQEAFLAAFRSISGFAGKCRLHTWLHRIAVNCTLMRLRARRSRPEISIEELVPHFAADGHHVVAPEPWGCEALELLTRRESRDLLRAAIDRLPDGYREVVVLRDIEGLGTEEAAELLGISVNAAKIRLHRARQALRTLLDRHFRETTS